MICSVCLRVTPTLCCLCTVLVCVFMSELHLEMSMTPVTNPMCHSGQHVIWPDQVYRQLAYVT
jgi:hypothetical protein